MEYEYTQVAVIGANLSPGNQSIESQWNKGGYCFLQGVYFPWLQGLRHYVISPPPVLLTFPTHTWHAYFAASDKTLHFQLHSFQ